MGPTRQPLPLAPSQVSRYELSATRVRLDRLRGPGPRAGPRPGPSDPIRRGPSDGQDDLPRRAHRHLIIVSDCVCFFFFFSLSLSLDLFFYFFFLAMAEGGGGDEEAKRTRHC